LAWQKVMAAYRRVYDSRRLQADCKEPGSAPELRSVIEHGLPFLHRDCTVCTLFLVFRKAVVVHGCAGTDRTHFTLVLSFWSGDSAWAKATTIRVYISAINQTNLYDVNRIRVSCRAGYE